MLDTLDTTKSRWCTWAGGYRLPNAGAQNSAESCPVRRRIRSRNREEPSTKEVDISGLTEERCELIHVLYNISSVCPSPLNLCGAEDDARVTTNLIIFKIRESENAMPCRQPNRPTKAGVHEFYTNAQTNTPYLARLRKRSSYKIKACSSAPLLVLNALKPHGLRPVMSKSMARVLGDFEGENNASLGIDRGSMLISN